jgi:PAS domain S-box-containing protein
VICIDRLLLAGYGDFSQTGTQTTGQLMLKVSIFVAIEIQIGQQIYASLILFIYQIVMKQPAPKNLENSCEPDGHVPGGNRDLNNPIQYLRDNIVHALLLSSVIIGLIAVIPSVWLSLKENLIHVAIFDIIVYLFVVYACFSKALSYRFRAVSFSVISYLVGLVLLVVVGPFGAGPVWLFAFPIITGVLFGKKAVSAALMITVATLAAVGIALHFDVILRWSSAAGIPTVKWIVICINFIFLNFLATLAIVTILRGLQSAFFHERQLGKTLSINQEKLQSANAELQREDEQKRIALEKLNESENRYRQLFNEAPVIYVITENRNGTPYIKDVNNLFIAKLGFKRSEVIDKPLSLFYSAESQKALMDNGGYSRALEGGFNDQERSLLTRDGGRMDTMLNVVPELNEHGEVIGTRAMFVDITLRKQAEEQARMLEANLHRSQRIEAIGTLAGGIAHDFNNILAAVMGYSEICLLQLAENDPVHGKIKAIYDAGGRARDLVRQILTFSRHNEQALMPVQIGPLIKEVLKLLRASLPATIDLQQEVQPQLPSIMADSTQIHQIVMNLCTNAAHAMEQTGGSLKVVVDQVELSANTIGLIPEAVPGRYVNIRVDDTGYGIPREIMPRIFEPYFTTKDKGEGTGLGLAVVHGIVKTYKGAIQVTSEPGRGTSFQVYLPAITTQAGSSGAHPEMKFLPKGEERILLMDDEAMVLDMTAVMLEKLGYRVTAFNNGDEALNRFKERPDVFDLLILDMAVPKTTGDQLAFRMRRIRPRIPVILCTGYSKRLISREPGTLGADAILMKPFKHAELARTVRNVLDGSSPEHQCLPSEACNRSAR